MIHNSSLQCSFQWEREESWAKSSVLHTAIESYCLGYVLSKAHQPALWAGFVINAVWALSDNLLVRLGNSFFISFLKLSYFVYPSGGSWLVSLCLPVLQLLVFLRIFLISSLLYSYTLQSQSFRRFLWFQLPNIPCASSKDFSPEFQKYIFPGCKLQVPHTSWSKLSR